MSSAMEQYFTDILDRKISSCRQIKQVSEKILNDLYNPGEYHFDEDLANKHVDFIETFCKTPSGKIGTKLTLQPFQKAWLQTAFGFVDDAGIRKYNEVLIVCGRKNGKSSLLSAILLDMLINDGEGAPQCVTAATMRDQACLTFNAAWRMVQQSPMLSKHVRKRAADLYYSKNMGYIKPLASATQSLDGLDLHCTVIDELAAIRNRDLYDLLLQGMAARKQPILWCITTNGYLRDGIYDRQVEYAEGVLDGSIKNEKFLPFIYTLDDPSYWDKPEHFVDANPGLGTIKSLEFLEQMVQKAKDDVSFKPTVLVKDFNLKQTGSTSWLRWEDLNNEAKVINYPFKYCICGMDAADTIDLNAAKAIVMKPGDPHLYVKSMYWMPQRVIDEFEEAGKRQGRDNVPYQLWKDLGYLRTVDTYKVDKRVFLDWFKELQYEEDIYPMYIGYDPWHIDDSLLREFKMEFGDRVMIPVRQGVATLSGPMKELKADLQNDLIVYDNNPIDKWCLANVAVKTDVNGNIQPIKADDTRKRIDGAMALIDAYVVYQDKADEFLTMI